MNLPLSEAVAKVTSVANEDILSSLDQVAGGHVPTQGAGPSNDEGLSRGEEDLAQKPDRITEDCDEVGSNV